jgi:hypothetical protein
MLYRGVFLVKETRLSVEKSWLRDGPSTDPCGIPESTSTCDEFTPSTPTVWFLSESQLFSTDSLVSFTKKTPRYNINKEDLDKLAQWGEDWFMQFHPAKCSPHRHQQAEPHSDRVFHSRTITCSSDIGQVPGGYHHRQSIKHRATRTLYISFCKM